MAGPTPPAWTAFAAFEERFDREWPSHLGAVPAWGTGIQADSIQDLITVDITDANNHSLVHEAGLNGFRTHAICLLPEVGAIVRAERFHPQLRQLASSSAGVRASIRPSPTEEDAPTDGDSRRNAVRKALTLPTAKGGGFLRGSDLRQLYSQRASQTRPIRSPAGLRYLERSFAKSC